MPKIFQYLNYLIRFYSNDHLPIHIHVQLQERETKVEIIIAEDIVTLVFKKVKGKPPLTEAEAKEVAVFVKAYYREIIEYKPSNCRSCTKGVSSSMAAISGGQMNFIVNATRSTNTII